MPDRDTLVDEVSAGGHDRNINQSGIDWRFTTDDARIKLKRLYPAMLPRRSASLYPAAGRAGGACDTFALTI